MTATAETAVLEVSGVQWATERVVEAVLGRDPGCGRSRPGQPDRRRLLRPDGDVGGRVGRVGARLRLSLPGQSVPAHICDPLVEPTEHPGAPF